MADWSLPTLSSIYADFLTFLKGRDFDAISLGHDTITNPIEGMIRYVRATNKFQEYLSGVWTDLNLSIVGGGTGAGTPAGARTNLGIGGMAIQDPNNVAITGGTITNLGALGINGNAAIVGGLAVGGNVNVIGTITGPGSGISAINGANIASGQIPSARLGGGTANIDKVLRGDLTWGDAKMYRSQQVINQAISGSIASADIALSGFTTLAKMFFVPATGMAHPGNLWSVYFTIPSVSILRVHVVYSGGSSIAHTITGMVLEIM